MSFISRNLKTAIKLPFAIAWDCISLGNLGEGTSTMNVIDEHRKEKQTDEVFELLHKIKDVIK